MKTRYLSLSLLSVLVLPFASSSCSSSPLELQNGAGGNVTVGGSLLAGGSSAGGSMSGGGSPGGTSSGGASSSAGAASGGVASGGGTPSGGASTSGGATAAGGSAPCTDVQLPDHEGEPCQQWAEWGQCDQAHVLDYCDKSCGRCTESGAGGGGSASGGSGAGGGIGDDNPWGTVSNGKNGWASRYWDCCKQSCGWSNNAGGKPVKSCDASGDNKVSADVQSACSNGSSTTCNSFVPKVYSSKVSFGFVATHAGSGVPCGKCYQVQFTGSSHNGGADAGSQALKDKVMIVMSTNIGGDVSSDGQMDFLIPGGGTGALYGCGTAWGVQKGDPSLGATYGGLRSGCTGDLNSLKSCVTQKCDSLFKAKNLDEMYEGCMWYVDWFEAADNPNFVVKDIDCPQEINSLAY